MVRGQHGALPRATPLPPNSQETQPPRQKLGKLAAQGGAAGKSGVPPPARAVTKDSPSSGGAPPPRTADATRSRGIPWAREAEAARRASRAVLRLPSMEAGEERRWREGVAQRPEIFFWGGTERECLGRLIRSPESLPFLLCLFPCGRRLSLSALTSIKLKLCALPRGPPLTAYSRSSFLRLRSLRSPTLRTDVCLSLLRLPT